MNIMPILLRSKGNKTMKIDQLIEYKKRKVFFFKNHAKDEAGRLFPELFIFILFYFFFKLQL